jgi:hypothetical protein
MSGPLRRTPKGVEKLCIPSGPRQEIRGGLIKKNSNHLLENRSLCSRSVAPYELLSNFGTAADWELLFVNRTSIIAAAFLASLMPATALAATVASTAIPDGTYTVKVVKVVDAKHVDVLMDNGQEATLPSGRSNVDFSKVQPNDQIKLSLIGGNVMVYMDLTGH